MIQIRSANPVGTAADSLPSADTSQATMALSTRVRRYTRAMRSHRWIDERSLALHSAVASKLEAQPELLDVARQNLQRWLNTRPAAALLEWQAVLDGARLSEIIDLLRSATPDAARLRQSSPFAGVLSPGERQSILDVYESRRA